MNISHAESAYLEGSLLFQNALEKFTLEFYYPVALTFAGVAAAQSGPETIAAMEQAKPGSFSRFKQLYGGANARQT